MPPTNFLPVSYECFDQINTPVNLTPTSKVRQSFTHLIVHQEYIKVWFQTLHKLLLLKLIQLVIENSKNTLPTI